MRRLIPKAGYRFVLGDDGKGSTRRTAARAQQEQQRSHAVSCSAVLGNLESGASADRVPWSANSDLLGRDLHSQTYFFDLHNPKCFVIGDGALETDTGFCECLCKVEHGLE